VKSTEVSHSGTEVYSQDAMIRSASPIVGAVPCQRVGACRRYEMSGEIEASSKQSMVS
jgi:hypothetical protein